MIKRLLMLMAAVWLLVVSANLLIARESTKSVGREMSKRSMKHHGRYRRGSHRGRWMGKHSKDSREEAKKLTKAQKKELLSVLKKHRPGHFERLMELRKEDSAAYREQLRRMWPRYKKLKNIVSKLREAHRSRRHPEFADKQMPKRSMKHRDKESEAREACDRCKRVSHRGRWMRKRGEKSEARKVHGRYRKQSSHRQRWAEKRGKEASATRRKQHRRPQAGQEELKGLPVELRKAAAAKIRVHIQIQRLVKKIRETSSAKKKKALMRQLHQAVGVSIKVEQAIKKQHLAQLEKHIAKMRAELKENDKQQKKIFAKRMKRIKSSLKGQSKPAESDKKHHKPRRAKKKFR